MDQYFNKVREYLHELEYSIISESAEDGVFVVENEDEGINNLILVCADPILIIEQYLFEIKRDNTSMFKQLLVKNRDILHGAFAIDETGKKVLFRDTLQLEHLDLNEMEGTLNSLSMLLSEYSNAIIEFSNH